MNKSRTYLLEVYIGDRYSQSTHSSYKELVLKILIFYKPQLKNRTNPYTSYETWSDGSFNLVSKMKLPEEQKNAIFYIIIFISATLFRFNSD